MTSSKNIIDCPSTKRARLDDEISRKRVTGNYLNDSAAVGEHLDHRDQGTEPATGGDGGDSDSETDVLPSDTIVAINYLKAQRLLPPGVVRKRVYR